jgi:hypothetical protein
LEGDVATTGVQAVAPRLFYDFRLDDQVPSDHQLRGIDQHLDLDDVRNERKPFYSSTAERAGLRSIPI